MAKSECCGMQKSEQAEANPMAMGTAKDTTSEMSQGGGPMEMMHKMMAQMGAGEGKAPPMDKMMGMCGEMLSTMKQTNALAVHATPELDKVFGEWLTRLEDQAIAVLATGMTDTAGLADALKISEASAIYLLNRLAVGGKVTLSARARTKAGGS